MLLAQVLKFFGRSSPGTTFLRKSAAKFSCQVKSIGRRDLAKNLIGMSILETLLDVARHTGSHAVFKNRYDFRPKFRVVRRGHQEFFSATLVECDGVKLISAYFPPAWQHRTGQKSRDQFLENQRLNIFRRDKV